MMRPLRAMMRSPAAAMPPAVATHRLSKRFGDQCAVDDLSLTIGRGETVGLLGANGAGKTTTLAMLLGLLLPSSGSLEVLGEDMVRHRHRVLGRINFSSPYVELPRRLTVMENLRVFAGLYGVSHPADRIGALSERLDLGPLMAKPVGALSSGQRSRVALAKAMINHPEILFLDEPTASLDPDTADRMRTALLEYQRERGATILLASHNMAEVERLCSSVHVMKAGRIVGSGTAAELIARFGRQTLEEVFLDIARNPSPESGR